MWSHGAQRRPDAGAVPDRRIRVDVICGGRRTVSGREQSGGAPALPMDTCLGRWPTGMRFQWRLRTRGSRGREVACLRYAVRCGGRRPGCIFRCRNLCLAQASGALERAARRSFRRPVPARARRVARRLPGNDPLESPAGLSRCVSDPGDRAEPVRDRQAAAYLRGRDRRPYLAIELIEREHGHKLAADVSEWFIRTEPRPADKSQRLSLRERFGVGNDRILKVLAEMEARLEEPASRGELAGLAGLSLRQL